MTELNIPQLSLVCLIGASGSGKSTFARKNFGTFEVLSSDFCRGLVSGDENDQAATSAAFEVLHFIAGKRLDAGLLTVVDATNVQPDARRQLVALAREHDVLPVAIVLDLPERVCLDRNASRPDRDFGDTVIRRQHDQLRRSLRHLGKEGFRKVHVLHSEDDVADAVIVREKLLTDLRDRRGPFDVIGDVHGCRAELETLFGELGYLIDRDELGRPVNATHPDGRTAVFVGDLVDRGPDSPGVLRLVMGMVAAGTALCVPGNHESKLVKALQGRNVQISHGLETTLAQLASESVEFRKEVELFCYGLVSHLVLDDGNLVVAHAGLKQAYQGRSSARVRSFALYGDTTGETDEFGLPVRYPWANDYRGPAMVLYGHTPTPEPEWVNNTMCLDTGCVFGGKLTAVRYPEKDVISVPAARVWYEPVKPLNSTVTDLDRRAPEELAITDVLGKRGVDTRLAGRVTVREENAAGALEVMSRFALEPRWLLYLPPTMAPTATETDGQLLEHPGTAFEFYRRDGISHVICEEKHMGSRAVVLICRDADTAADRFGATDGSTGAVYTRTGRSFFDHDTTETLLSTVRQAVEDTNLWEELGTNWLLLDTELLPWSAKAEDLLRQQYASVGAAANAALPAAVSVLQASADRGLDVTDLLARTVSRAANATAFRDAYRRYVWPTHGLDGVQIAPFQVLATEGHTHSNRDHSWHLGIADRLVAAAPSLIRSTRRLVVDTSDDSSVTAGINWWTALTNTGGEGMVVKPLANLTKTARGYAQPGVKVRGPEYLRIIYGPDYTEPANLTRLRDRNLGHKRSLAAREYALGIESLERSVAGEPLWRIHEPVFAVLALESEPIDPRL
ncbi:polynucleotide kinase-phosphatase [Jatrophihabitans sp. GAS493]|uniref:polynucleotide kinase-phosphatase n=1 Tax=Jatrophihabitans sp. GAS493 TaxID=1907575 RepID=UPI000BB843F4|nr:polynucleotide kinase-phosphatase [Jatrophihabitans sp. GAS493]SOD73121.1 polynucleotide kinase-phosphatase [Jatrophihabitans sp. GAS493]